MVLVHLMVVVSLVVACQVARGEIHARLLLLLLVLLELLLLLDLQLLLLLLVWALHFVTDH